MNGRVNIGAGVLTGSQTDNDAWQAVQHILESPAFSKAPRMCQLLTFLMKKKLDGTEHQITEYAIGIEVFRRDARLYDTCIDPVVRVQLGRLRGRLEAYYAALGTPPVCHIAIPMGSYIPVLTGIATLKYVATKRKLQLVPLRNLTCESSANTFVCGLEEELGSRLFHTLGSAVELTATNSTALHGESNDLLIGHRLEGSIRVEQQHVRASMRLVKGNAGKIAWLSQFDCSGDLGMSLQEELAMAICDKLQVYFAAISAPEIAEKVN
jgi:TolB-like protein